MNQCSNKKFNRKNEDLILRMENYLRGESSKAFVPGTFCEAAFDNTVRHSFGKKKVEDGKYIYRIEEMRDIANKISFMYATYGAKHSYYIMKTGKRDQPCSDFHLSESELRTIYWTIYQLLSAKWLPLFEEQFDRNSKAAREFFLNKNVYNA